MPRQLSYNPIFENAQSCSFKLYNQLVSKNLCQSDNVTFSAKPLFSHNIGTKFAQYFTIDQKPVLNVQEDGSGDIDPLWFQVFSPQGSFYSSNLAFNPKRTTFGSMIYTLVNITDHISTSANTALISTRNNIGISETNIDYPGTTPQLQTVTQVLSNTTFLKYGAIGDTLTKSGIDDIQIKLIYHSYSAQEYDHYEYKKLFYEAYLLAGIPTGQGSQAIYLFEPLVGSSHPQIGLGGNLHYSFGKLRFQAEAKWRYAFAGDEIRSFDLTKNGQWSRYMPVVDSLFPASQSTGVNNLTFLTQVTPRNSFDLYLAAYYDLHETLHVELGYDLWVRQAESIQVNPIFSSPAIGIADLDNLYPLQLTGTLASAPSAGGATSASGANISQAAFGPNIAPSDSPIFIGIQPTDLNLTSACAQQSLSNSIYGSIAYTKELYRHALRSGLSIAYECGHGINVPNNISVMLTIDLLF